MRLSITLIITLTATICAKQASSPIAHVSAQIGKIFYKIPDPFGENIKSKTTGYYSIKSFQTTISSHKKRTQVEVEEYFSFAYGLTYSLHRESNDHSKEFAIIGDGPRGKSYIIRNPSLDVGNGARSGQLDCELDHVHHHKQVFPWQYVYNLKDEPSSNNQTTSAPEMEQQQQQESPTGSNSNKKRIRKRDKKNRWSSKRFIYGVGAIWMNAIKRGLVSDQVGDDSLYQGSNFWQMYDGDLDMRLLFDKPKVDDWAQLEQAERERLVASSPLESIHLTRRHAIEKDDQLDGSSSGDSPTDIIVVQEFTNGINVNDPSLKRFFGQLAECRRQTKRHRIFPSLMRAVSMSPGRLYALEYVERKYAGLMVDEDGSQRGGGGKFDPKHHRVVHDTEVHTEWFSFKQEAQVDVYEPAEVLLSSANDHLVDIFIKRLSWNANGNRSSRHSARHYHLLERNGNIESCKMGEADPLPLWFNLMIRKIHLRRPNGNTISGLITGLGALIMNAAEIHYKQFNLFKRTIITSYDPMNPQVEQEVKVDEWQLYHRQTGRSVHFYFRSKEKGDSSSQQEIGDLLRVDVRDSQGKNTSSDDIIGDNNSLDDSDMLARYDILSLETDKSKNEAEFMFTPPVECRAGTEEVDSSIDDEEDNFHQDEDFFATDSSSDSDDGDGDGDDSDNQNNRPHQGQEEGEDFEFEPGKMAEDFQFPDIYDYFDGRLIYKMVYTIELDAANDDNESGPKKRIHLMDMVDMAANLAKHSVFNSKQAFEAMKPDLEFYIDYESELIFRHQRVESESGEQVSNKWLIVDELDSWFRLLSAKLWYYDKNMTVRDRVRSYGLGALWRSAYQSEYSYFVGMRKGTFRRPEDNCEYREVVWGLEDDGDSELQIRFKFLWNATQNNLDSAVGHSRRPNELLSLNSVSVAPQLDADLDDGSGDNEQSHTKSVHNFVGFMIPEPIEITPLERNSFYLPEACEKLAKERAEESAEVVDDNKPDLVSRIPSFWDYIHPSNTYSAIYYVSHIPKSEESKKATVQSISITRIAEHVDRNKSLGKLTIGSGPETREVFIDDNKRTIYSFMAATGVCKRLTSLKGLLELVTGLEPVEGTDFNSGRMFGLADLWIHLSQSSQVQLEKVESNKDMDTFEITERRTYHLTEELDNISNANKIAYKLAITFRSHPGISPNVPRSFTPESIDFRPSYIKSFSGRTPIHRTTIHIDSITNDASVSEADLELPDECSSISNQDPPLDDDTTQPGVVSPPGTAGDNRGLQFPRLSDILQGSPFYMRSERASATTSPQSDSNVTDRKLYVMDEWLTNVGDVRMRTYGLQRDFDLLIYAATKEAFDLSTPFKCPRVLPKLYQSSATRSNSSLLEFWAGETSYVENLSDLYYGAISLWRQAELNEAHAKLVSSMELAPKLADGSDDIFEHLKRDMQTEVWRISSPSAGNPRWIYDMHFEFFSNDEIGRKWHILDKIDIQSLENKDDHILVDVINYRYEHSDREILAKFNLPEGYNCIRNLPVRDVMLKDGDDLNVDWSSYHQMWYEASLELIDGSATISDDPEMGALKLPEGEVLPTATGYILKASNYDNQESPIDLYVHYKKSRNLNGQTTSSKTVFDRITSLIYISDERVGFCAKTNEVSIEFPSFERTEYLILDNKTMQLLFGDRKSYLPINRYTDADGYSYSVYERNIDELNLQSSLEGPATIVRKFQHHNDTKMPHSIDNNDNDHSIRMHKSISIKMLVFDATRTRIKAILSLSLVGVSNIGLTELMEHTNVAQCYNDGDDASDRQVRTYVFEYLGSEMAIKSTVATRSLSTTDHFLVNFLKVSKLLPTQLAGSPRLELVTDSNNRKLRINLQVIEAPTAIEYASRRMVGTRMSLELEAMSEMRLVSSLAECSRWCDQVGCVAMTHCLDHTCRVVTPSMLHGGGGSGGGSSDDSLTASDLSKLFEKVSDSDCSNFIWMSKRPSRLEKFASSMELLINQGSNRSQLEPLSLILFGNHFETSLPARFYEIKDDLNSFNEDDSEGQNNNMTMGGSKVASSSIYKILGHNRHLNQVKFYNLIDENRLDRRFTLDIKHGHSYGDCLELCRRDADCVMVSHCKRPTGANCHLVSGKGDLKALEQAIEDASGQEAGSCTVNIKDFLVEYNQFSGTQEPTSYEMKLDNYTPLECAALCSLNYDSSESFKCLSFDSCVTRQQHQIDADADESHTDHVATTIQLTCYLQTKHIMLDSFDRSILAPNWHTENSTEGMATCEHYSKSMLADYKRIPNKQFAVAEEQQVVRGSSPDQCAIECQLDQQCQAFEYCFDDERQPVQSCYFIRQRDLDSSASTQEASNSLSPGIIDKIQQQSVDSHKCSIYVLDHQFETYGIDEKSHIIKIMNEAVRIVANESGFLGSTFRALLYVTMAIFLGSLIQIVYMKFFGHSIVVHRRLM